jgi:hypothetical protein
VFKVARTASWLEQLVSSVPVCVPLRIFLDVKNQIKDERRGCVNGCRMAELEDRVLSWHDLGRQAGRRRPVRHDVTYSTYTMCARLAEKVQVCEDG